MINTNRILSSNIVVAGLIAMMMMIIISSNSSSSDKSLKLSEKAYGQSNANTATNSTTFPVLLIHGYMEDAAVWNKWVDLLKKDGISAYPITFKQSDDKCGSAAEHAKELSKIIGQINIR